MDSGESKRIRQLAQKAKAKVKATVRDEQVEKVAERHGRNVSSYQRIQLLRAVPVVDPFLKEPNLRTQMEAFTQANVQLIRGVADKTSNDVEALALRVVQGAAAGQLPRTLAKDLEDIWGYPPERAKAIARDQVGKFYGQLNRIRQQAIGFKKYIWRTMNDDRVRPEHEEREGDEFLWDDPPEGGHPGEAINCRCYAEPVIDAGDDEDDDS